MLSPSGTKSAPNVICLSTKKSYQDRIADLTRQAEAAELEKANRKAKFGRGSWARAPLLSTQQWKRDFDAHHLLNLMLLNRPAFTYAEFSILAFLLNNHGTCDSITRGSVSKGIGLDLSDTKRSISRLIRCGMIVNIGSETKHKLVVNPVVGYWDLNELRRLRKSKKAGSGIDRLKNILSILDDSTE